MPQSEEAPHTESPLMPNARLTAEDCAIPTPSPPLPLSLVMSIEWHPDLQVSGWVELPLVELADDLTDVQQIT